MKLSSIDYALVCLANYAATPLRALGNLESNYLRDKLDDFKVERPLFVTGLARSGTTILLERLEKTGYFATHRYRDFPFLSIPYLWNKYLDLAGVEETPVERPHRDRIKITANSPEAYEEPIWQQFFPTVHATQGTHRLDASTRNQEFEDFFRDHLRKLLLVRQRDRYLSKGNYNVTRIEYLGRLFPDAQFVIPVRHPVDHVTSLVRQHQLFQEYAAADSRIATYLASAGHYEFGPQRRAIRMNQQDGDRTELAWRQGNEHQGYAIQWSQIYRFVDDLRHRGDELSTRVHVVRYEDFCERPCDVLKSILSRAHCPVEILDTSTFRDITPSTRQTRDEGLVGVVWREVGLVAELFGYRASSLANNERPPVNLLL